MENNSTSKKEISFFWAVVPFLFMIISMLFTVVVLEQAPHIPLNDRNSNCCNCSLLSWV